MSDLIVRPRVKQADTKSYVAPYKTKLAEDPRVIKLMKEKYSPPVVGNPRSGYRIADHAVFAMNKIHKPGTADEKAFDSIFVLDFSKSASPEKVDFYKRKGFQLIQYDVAAKQDTRPGVVSTHNMSDGSDINSEIISELVIAHQAIDGYLAQTELKELKEQTKTLKARVSAEEKKDVKEAKKPASPAKDA